METSVSRFYKPYDGPAGLTLPLFELPRPSAGFPSPAMDYEEKVVDLNAVLIQHKESTFLTRAEGQSMSPRINDGDLLVVDKRAEIKNGDIIIIGIHNNFFVKIFNRHTDGSIQLLSVNSDYEPINFPDEDPFAPLGKVIAIIQQLR